MAKNQEGRALDFDINETYEIETELDTTELDDPRELADRYADFYQQLKGRGIHVDHAAMLTGDLIQAEQLQMPCLLPEITIPELDLSKLGLEDLN